MIRIRSTSLTIASLAFAVACGDDDTPNGPSNGGNGGNGGGPTQFTLTIENISGRGPLPGPISPGVWAVHDDSAQLFADGMEASMGIEAIAEDGMPSTMADAIAGAAGISSSAAFATPDGGSMGPAFPGDRYVLSFEAEDPTARLSLATMLVQSNDVFIAPRPEGIALFDADDAPIVGDITAELELWDAGTEANEAPGMGPNQAPRQAAGDTGRAEGVVGRFADSTRSLPQAPGIAELTVEEDGGAYTFTLRNVAMERGSLVTPIAPVFWAVHDDTYALFTDGEPDRGEGLETLAEDGGPGDLVMSAGSAGGVDAAGAQAVTVERPNDPPGPAMGGEAFRFEVTPSADYPYLTIAAMVVASNDVFLAFPAAGLRLVDESGNARAADDVQADARRMLAIWDAGTEANEVPGVGPYQPANQPGANMGPDDPNPNVRRYSDSTNDLADAPALFDVSVRAADGPGFMVRVENASGGTPFPAVLTPVAWAVHDDTATLFTPGAAASEAVERIAEDGMAGPLAGELGNLSGVSSAGVQANPVNGTAEGPIPPGNAYEFLVMPDADHRMLSIATMVVPSNDTFLAFGPSGVALLDETGAARSEADIASDIAQSLAAWDAGTELNQAGAAGPDQAPRQAAPDTGAAEGMGLIRTLASPVWAYPNVSDVIRATLTLE
jgi:hypothetical protein